MVTEEKAAQEFAFAVCGETRAPCRSLFQSDGQEFPAAFRSHASSLLVILNRTTNMGVTQLAISLPMTLKFF